jgi:hypothetical protein
VASTSGDHILSNINNNQKRHKRVTILKISKNELVQKLGGKAPRKTGYTADRRNLRHGVFLDWLQVIFEPLARKRRLRESEDYASILLKTKDQN